MTNDCKTCPVSTGTHKPAEAVHQIDEPMPLSAKEMSEVACTLYEKANAAGEVPEGGRMAFIIGVGWAMQELDLRAQSARIAELEDATDIAIERIAELESQLEAIGAGGVEPLRKQAAATQAVQATVPLPLLVRDIARDLEITVPQACIALKPLGNYSTNSAVTAEMARMLRDHFPAPAHPAEGVPAQCPNINEPRGCWRVACQLGGKCREPERSATQPAAQGMEADLTDAQIDEAFNQMPDGAAGFLKSWGYRQFARAVLAAQAKQGGAA